VGWRRAGSEEGTIYRAPTLCDSAKLNGAKAPKLHKPGKEKEKDLTQRTQRKGKNAGRMPFDFAQDKPGYEMWEEDRLLRVSALVGRRE